MLINYPFTPSAAILFRQSRASVGIVYSIPTAMNEASGDRWVLVNSIAKPLGYEHYNKLDALRHAPIELKKNRNNE